MTEKNRPLISILPALAMLILFLGVAPLARASDPIVVIVNSSNPVDNLSKEELKKLFLSDRSHWDTGKLVTPVIVTRGAPERTSFLQSICGMSDSDLAKYFMQAAFTGKPAVAPREVGTAAAVKSFVAASQGAIGFVRAADFHGDGSDGGIKAVRVDGALASDPSYKVRM